MSLLVILYTCAPEGFEWLVHTWGDVTGLTWTSTTTHVAMLVAYSWTTETTETTETTQHQRDRELRESRRHERQLLVREVVCLVLVGVLVVVRQLWLV